MFLLLFQRAWGDSRSGRFRKKLTLGSLQVLTLQNLCKYPRGLAKGRKLRLME